MKKIVLAILVVVLVAVGFMVSRPSGQKSQVSPILETNKVTVPSETLKDYTDPAGFSFSYPDNLSIIKNDLEDSSVYADLQLASKDVNGSLNLKITDSKFKTLDEWLKLNKAASKEEPKEAKLGNLKALELKTSDRLLLGALDQGILFTIEIPRVEEEFWMKVYDKILSDFSFVAPAAAAAAPDGVSFEGEEVVE